MTEPEEQDDELELDQETVRDLEPNETDAENIRGGLDDERHTGGSKPCN